MSRFFIILLSIILQLSVTKLAAQVDVNDTLADDKATVYILRTNGVHVKKNIPYFVDEIFIGHLDKGKYLKLELEPGTHMIWVKGKKFGYNKTNFQAGQTYVLKAKAHKGSFDNGSIALKPILQEESKVLNKLARRIEEKKEQTFSTKELVKGQREFRKLIKEAYEQYEVWLEKGDRDGFKLNPVHFVLHL